MAVMIGFLVLTLLCAVMPVRLARVRTFWGAGCVVLLSLLAMVLRYLCMDFVSADYTLFLSQWVDFFRRLGGFSALGHPVGNYNIPYLYFLAGFSYLPVRDLYLIKLLSILFDVLLAYASMRLLRRFTESTAKLLGVYFTVLLLPTVILNGALWGQCDSIYTAFAVLSVALALEDRPVPAMISIALSFAFKLQAVFVMPVFFLLLCSGRIRWYHLFVFPLTYFVLILPAVLLGRPLADTVLLYINQGYTVGDGANYNSSSVFAFFRDASPALMRAGICAAFGLVVLVYLLVLLRRKAGDPAVILTAAVIFSLGIPFLLPHMHDRYFFPADVLTTVYAFAVSWRFAMPCLVSFGSLLGYHAFLRMRYLLPMRYGAMGLAVVLSVLLADLCVRLFSPATPQPVPRTEGGGDP